MDLTVVNKHEIRAAGLHVAPRKEIGGRLVRAEETTVKESDEKVLLWWESLQVGPTEEAQDVEIMMFVLFNLGFGPFGHHS